MKRIISVLMISLISIVVFSLNTVNIQAAEDQRIIKACIYLEGDKSSYVGVNSEGEVYSFNMDTGALSSKQGETVDGRFDIQPCPRNLYKYTSPVAETVYSISDCNLNPLGREQNFRHLDTAECKFLLTSPLFTSYRNKTSYTRVEQDDLTKANETAAVEARNDADQNYTDCLALRHSDSYKTCQSLHGEEMSSLISCVKQQVSSKGGTYHCDTQEQALISADRAFRSAKAGHLIANSLDDLSCEELLGSEFLTEIKNLFFIVQVLAISIAIVLTAVDFMKFVFGGDEDKYKQMFKNLKIRIIVIIILMILPALISFILSTTMSGENIPSNPFCE